jgi:N-sulfoglucosamine sulfohydrolase
VPEVVTGRSLWQVLRSEKSGLVDAERTWVVTGRERHVAEAREGFLPYPQRALHTSTHLYIINFKPERYPLGDPGPLLAAGKPIAARRLANDTRAAFPDMDASPTKAWLVGQRNNPEWKAIFERAFGLRPREELYDLIADPDQLHNLAADPASARIRADLETRLLAELKRTGDSRVADGEPVFEKPPFTSSAPP